MPISISELASTETIAEPPEDPSGKAPAVTEPPELTLRMPAPRPPTARDPGSESVDSAPVTSIVPLEPALWPTRIDPADTMPPSAIDSTPSPAKPTTRRPGLATASKSAPEPVTATVAALPSMVAIVPSLTTVPPFRIVSCPVSMIPAASVRSAPSSTKGAVPATNIWIAAPLPVIVPAISGELDVGRSDRRGRGRV